MCVRHSQPAAPLLLVWLLAIPSSFSLASLFFRSPFHQGSLIMLLLPDTWDLSKFLIFVQPLEVCGKLLSISRLICVVFPMPFESVCGVRSRHSILQCQGHGFEFLATRSGHQGGAWVVSPPLSAERGRGYVSLSFWVFSEACRFVPVHSSRGCCLCCERQTA